MAPPLLLAFLVSATMLWTPCSPWYMYMAQHRIQGKMHWLSRELVIDAEMKIKAVQHYRSQYYKSPQYQLGDMIYELRDFFKKIVHIYQGTDKNISYSRLNHHHNVKNFVLVHRMSMEIENKVDMVLTWEKKRESKTEHHERMRAVMRSGALLEDDEPEDDEPEDVPLREAMVRQRMARAALASEPALRAPRRRTPPRRAPPPAPAHDKSRNQKWRYQAKRS